MYNSYLAFFIILAFLSSCKSAKITSNTKRYTSPTKKIIAITTIKHTVANKASLRTTNVNKVIATAKTYMGTPHLMGGITKKGIDCSGLMLQSYKAINFTIPRVSRAQAKAGIVVPIDKLQKGDLIFFTYPGGTRITHVGMIIEVKGKEMVTFIHASLSKGVREDQVFSDYWRKLIITARRLY